MINQLTGQPISNSELEELVTLTKKLLALRTRIEKGEKLLEELNKEELELSTQKIPTRMVEIGLSEFKLADGSAVTIQKVYSGKIKPEAHDLAIEWLEERNLDSIVKRKIEIPFEKGANTTALEKLLKKAKVEFVKNESIHAQTMKAFVREMEESNKPLPEGLFTTYVGSITKIIEPK